MCFTTSFFTAEWPTHVTSGNEWIVDDSTLSHPPKKGSIDCIKKLFDPTAKKEHSPVHPIESYLAGHLKVCVCKSVLCSVTIVPEPSFLVNNSCYKGQLPTCCHVFSSFSSTAETWNMCMYMSVSNPY